jgi:hypothetical protein
VIREQGKQVTAKDFRLTPPNSQEKNKNFAPADRREKSQAVTKQSASGEQDPEPSLVELAKTSAQIKIGAAQTAPKK